MKTSLRILAALALAGAAASQAQPAVRTPQSAVAFVDVTVIPMDRERVIEHQTVIVRNGRIAEVGPAARVRVPGGALRIDGRGKWLMPGLAEMHAHVLPAQAAGNADERLNRDIFFLYVANGITSIRAMLGAPNQLVLRDRLARSELLGPTMYVGAPSLSGNSAPNPDTAAKLVRAHKAAGYDFLKLHPGLSRATYDAIVRTGREVGITWAGHVSAEVGIDRALETRQSTIDHLDGYIEGAVSDATRGRIASPTVQVTLAEIVGDVDEAKLRALAGRTRRAGIRNVPTMFLWESFFSAEPPESMAARSEMKYATPAWVAGWTTQKRNRIQGDAQNGVTPEISARYLALRRLMLKALADSGAPLLMGTDSPQMFNVPGFALHHEIALMQRAGLTPYQVLVSGTRNIAEYAARELKQDGRFGTVAVGNRADLVLLDANPLADVTNVARRSGVMVKGRWLDAAEIERGLSELAARHGTPTTPARVGVQNATPRTDAEREVLAVVQRVFDAMRSHDTTMLRSAFDSSARMIRMHPGTGALIAESPTNFIRAVGSAAEPWNERIWSPEVRIDGALATVWGEYDFYAGDRFSHCGVDAFMLIRTQAGWKIVALSDTMRREGCPQRPPLAP